MSEKPAAKTPASEPKPPAPRLVVIAAILLLVSGLAGLGASFALRTDSVQTFVRESTRDSIADNTQGKLDDARKAGAVSAAQGAKFDEAKRLITDFKSTAVDQLQPKVAPISADVTALNAGANQDRKNALKDAQDQLNQVKDISDNVSKTQKSILLLSIVGLIALAVAAAAAFKGRHWARWAVLGLWVLATFSGSLSGIGSVMSVTADIPPAFKFPTFLAGAALVVAVVLVNLKPSVAFFNHGRPPRPARPAAGQRRGLFAPPPRPAEKAEPAEPAVQREKPSSSRARTKQRADSSAVSKGADLARSRAKAASKSRRSGG